MMSNLKAKLDAIFSFLDKKTAQDNQDAVNAVVAASIKEERALFEKAIKETLDSKAMSYDEVVARVQISNFSPEDKNIILAQIADYEATAIKTASINSQEVNMLDPVVEEINRIGVRLPAYAKWLATTLQKDGHYFGTGGKPQVDQQSLQTKKDEVNYMNESKEEEASRMKRDNKRTEPEQRLNTPANKTAATDSYVKTPGGNATESTPVDSKKWDNKLIEKEVADAKTNEEKGHSRDTADRKKKDEHLRASDALSVKFSDVENAWVIADKTTGEIAVQASLADITGGREIDAAALKDIKSATFGDMIKEDIDSIGLEATARNLLGDTFDKLAAESLAETKVKTSDDHAETLFVLKGMLATLKSNLTKVATHPLVAGLIKKAEGGIAVIEEAIGEANPPTEISFAGAADPMEALVSVDEMFSGEGDAAAIAEELKAKLTDPADQAKLDELVAMATSAAAPEEGTKPLEDAAPKEDEPKEDEPKEDDKPAFGKDSAVRKALKKLAAKDTGTTAKRPKADEGEYDVTPKLNWNEMAEHNKGNIKMDGKEFMTFESLRNEFKGLATDMPTGKLAAFLGNFLKGAELAKAAGMDAKTYYTQVLGDPSYVKEWMSDKQPEQIQKEFTQNEREANKNNNAYASGAIKMKQAMEMAQKMQKKGMVATATDALNQQVKDFMAMDEESFKAFASSVELISPTTEVEDGRFKVKKMAKPDRDGNVVIGAVDGIECVYMNGSDIQTEDGVVTKAHLTNALDLLKRAFDEGFLEEPLSGGKIQNTPGVDLQGLNLGKDAGRPVLTPKDLI